ncbi:MAG: tetratricopeptide repeat protein [Spirochaetes bacterium]|jgi:tetratricopeptide (TPR) repeat protein|nr:tetratricopeptide repeat protein [Spirochaetota bacterium]
MADIGLDGKIKRFLADALSKSVINDYRNAMEDLRAAEALDRDNPEVLYNLGICYARTGLYKSAAEYFRRVIDLPLVFVDINTVRKLLAYCLIMYGEYAAAERLLETSIGLSPRDAAALNMRGYCREKTGRYDEAIESYREIIGIDPRNWNAHNSLAFLIAESGGDLAEAADHASIALKAKPSHPAYLDTMGYVCMKRGQARTARDHYKKALARMPESTEIKAHIAELLGTRPGKRG